MSLEVATDPEWEVVRAKVYSAENLSLEEKAAAYEQLSKQDLTLVEQLLDGRSQQDLTDVLRNQLPGPSAGARGGAAAGGAGGVGKKGEEADRLEEVELTLDEEGVTTTIYSMLWNGKLYLDGLEKNLAAKKLKMWAVNGKTGILRDGDGYSRIVYKANDKITINVVPKPGAKVFTAYAHQHQQSWWRRLIQI